MTDAELKGIAAQALNMARRDMEQRDFNFLLATYHVGDVPPLHRMKKVEEVIIAKLGENWLNHGRAKDIGFFLMRKAVDLVVPEAVVFCTMSNGFRSTEKFAALPEDQRMAILNAGHDRHHEACKEGYFVMGDCISSIAQTPTRVCNYVQPIEHGMPEPPEVTFFPQECFDGRMKMYGAQYLTPEKGQIT